MGLKHKQKYPDDSEKNWSIISPTDKAGKNRQPSRHAGASLDLKQKE